MIKVLQEIVGCLEKYQFVDKFKMENSYSNSQKAEGAWGD